MVKRWPYTQYEWNAIKSRSTDSHDKQNSMSPYVTYVIILRHLIKSEWKKEIWKLNFDLSENYES